ncbi:histidine kinase [Sphingomonas sp. ASV193]|uniref:sensor histidine kinase n=1 Tax=Sphingomonas sp. ASV193 TaxID=3144405 RepID=UPI0032E86363
MASEPISQPAAAASPPLAATKTYAPARRSKGPARPILKGVGLDAPFFADKNKAFWVLQSIGWTGYFVLRVISGVANSMGLMFIVHTLLLTATGYSLTLLMASLYRRLIQMRAIWTVILSLATVVLASSAFSFIETWSLATFINPEYKPAGLQFFGAIILDFAILAAWSALYYGINYYLLLEDEINQRERLQNQASSAQLAMLRYQLNPHFLFNTLNSISTLVLLKQTERANAMLARLSSFLRYTLVNEPTAQVTLAQEVETLKLYLEIEKMRFEDRLRPHFRIDAETIGARLPSLLLQPLVENAIKYAVTPAEDGADIWITASRQGQAARIEVADSGPGGGAALIMAESTGVGLANIQDRLAQAYGPAHGFTTKTNEHGGFSVILEIPLDRAAAKED